MPRLRRARRKRVLTYETAISLQVLWPQKPFSFEWVDAWEVEFKKCRACKVFGKSRMTMIKARGRARHRPGTMNRLEANYAAWLESQKREGKILWWKFESMKFKLADKCWYSPDFIVMTAEMQLEAHEVKGFWEDDARVKIKVVAEMFPIRLSV